MNISIGVAEICLIAITVMMFLAIISDDITF